MGRSYGIGGGASSRRRQDGAWHATYAAACWDFMGLRRGRGQARADTQPGGHKARAYGYRCGDTSSTIHPSSVAAWVPARVRGRRGGEGARPH